MGFSIEISEGKGWGMVQGGTGSHFYANGRMNIPHFLLGNCLLQRAAEAGNEAAALFLATNGAHVNHRNKWVSLTGQSGEVVLIYGRNGSGRCRGKNGIDSFLNFCQSNTCMWLKKQ